MFLGRGMVSDDTEHTSMVARALAESGGDVEQFTDSLARQLKRWVVALPPGVGLATMRGAFRLLVGVSPKHSGVHSAGNGPAMRSALLGVCATDDGHLVDLVRASTQITHTDARARDGAVLVARLARQLATASLDPGVIDGIGDMEFRERVRDAWQGEFLTPADYGAAAGYQRGVSGFIVHTVPAAVYCTLRTGEDARFALESAIRLGGDTDTTAAIVGALVGARDGAAGLPQDWLRGVRDWPVSTANLRALADSLAHGGGVPPQRWIAAAPRNLGLLVVIFGHIALRLLGR